MRNLFHDEEDGPREAFPGLPQALPEGERVLWQGKPNTLTLAIHAFHIRFIALWFGGMAVFKLFSMARAGAPGTDMAVYFAQMLAIFGVAMGIVVLLAWLMARAAMFTVTTNRVVIRSGAALRKYVNLPFAAIGSASVMQHGAKAGSIALQIAPPARASYFRLWPFVRPMKISRPEPLLRALPDVDAARAVLVSAMEQWARQNEDARAVADPDVEAIPAAPDQAPMSATA